MILTHQQRANAQIEDIYAELRRATESHADLNSYHEAYAVILEELEEFKYWAFMKASQRVREDARKELIQTATMCLRAILDLNLDGPTEGDGAS